MLIHHHSFANKIDKNYHLNLFKDFLQVLFISSLGFLVSLSSIGKTLVWVPSLSVSMSPSVVNPSIFAATESAALIPTSTSASKGYDLEY